MGLDMYLTRRVYVGNKHKPEEKRVKVVVPSNQEGVTFPVEEIDESQLGYLILDVAYWRKANAIHAWFVENVQSGVDDCKEYYCDPEKLKELLHLCYQTRDLIEKKLLTEETAVLPTQSGFFFGSTDYDEWYKEDIEETIRQLEALDLDDAWAEYYYRSSW